MRGILSGASAPGALVLILQLVGVGAICGLAVAALLARTATLRALVETFTGIVESKLKPRVVIPRFAGLGLIAGVAVWVTAVFTHARLGPIPGMWPLLGAFGLGVVIRLATGRPILVAPDGDPEEDRNAPGSIVVAGVFGDAAVLLAAALIAYRTYLPTVAAGASLGGFGGVGWLVLRGPVLRWRRAAHGRPIGPLPQLGTVLGEGIVVGVLASSFALAGGLHPAPAWSAFALLGLAVVAQPVRSHLAPPPIAASRMVLGGHETMVLEVHGRGHEHAPPILFVHGLFGNAEWWRALMQAGARRVNCRMAAVSVPGVAPGVGELGEGAVFPQLREWLSECIPDLFPGEKPVVCAASLLGYPTMLIAQNEDAPMAGAFLIGTMGMELSPGMKKVTSYFGRATIKGAARIASPRLRGRLFKYVYHRVVNPDAAPWAVALLGDLTSDPQESAAVAALLARLAEEVQTKVDLKLIRKPVEFTWGPEDSISDPANAATVERVQSGLLRSFTYRVGGHTPFDTDADMVADELVEFLSWLSAGTGTAASAVAKPARRSPATRSLLEELVGWSRGTRSPQRLRWRSRRGSAS